MSIKRSSSRYSGLFHRCTSVCNLTHLEVALRANAKERKANSALMALTTRVLKQQEAA
jgi:hypothetical protein